MVAQVSPTYALGVNWDAALAVLRALERERVEYVLVGAAAMNLHGVVRNTEDLDLFVNPTEENVARLRTALHSVFHDSSIDEISAADLAGDYPAVQYLPPDDAGGLAGIDILARLGEAFSFDDIEAMRGDVEGTSVRLATPRMLYRMKRGTVRPLDHEDARRLRDAFGLDDEEG
jgi:hypothetical protein